MSAPEVLGWPKDTSTQACCGQYKPALHRLSLASAGAWEGRGGMGQRKGSFFGRLDQGGEWNLGLTIRLGHKASSRCRPRDPQGAARAFPWARGFCIGFGAGPPTLSMQHNLGYHSPARSTSLLSSDVHSKQKLNTLALQTVALNYKAPEASQRRDISHYEAFQHTVTHCIHVEVARLAAISILDVQITAHCCTFSGH